MKTYQDYYFKKAKKEKYPARSVYKLQEIDKKFRLFKKGQKVLDLGACLVRGLSGPVKRWEKRDWWWLWT